MTSMPMRGAAVWTGARVLGRALRRPRLEGPRRLHRLALALAPPLPQPATHRAVAALARRPGVAGYSTVPPTDGEPVNRLTRLKQENELLRVLGAVLSPGKVVVDMY